MNKTPEPSNAYLATVQRHRGGKALDEASAKLAEVVAAVVETGKAGTVTITLKIAPASRGNGAVTVTDEVTAKIPQSPRPDSFWFASEDGALSKDDPRQKELFVPKAVTGGAADDADGLPGKAVNA